MTHKALGGVAVAAAIAGVLSMLVAGGWDVWPPALAWAGGALLFGAVLITLRRKRWTKIGLAAAAIIATVLLGWVGGLFMLPAALLALAWALARPSAGLPHMERCGANVGPWGGASRFASSGPDTTKPRAPAS